jgi:large subunit ribosomal protein L24
MKIHSGDTVVVIAGADKGRTGKVKSVDREKKRVLVEGINMVYKHVKPSQKNPQGGRLHKEMPLDVSNVMVLCPKTNKPTKVGYRYLKDGSKERFARASGESLGVISPPKKSYAGR